MARVRLIALAEDLPSGYSSLWFAHSPAMGIPVLVVAPSDQTDLPAPGEEDTKDISGALVFKLSPDDLTSLISEPCSICKLNADGSGYFKSETVGFPVPSKCLVSEG